MLVRQRAKINDTSSSKFRAAEAFSGKSLDNISYDESGIHGYQVESTYLEHYSVVGDTHFQNPVLSVFREGHTIEWQK